MTTDLERRLRALRDHLPEPPHDIDLVAGLGAPDEADVVVVAARPPHRRTRWVVAGLVAAALVAAVVVAAEAARGGGHTDRRDAVSVQSTPRIDPATQIVHDGDQVEGTGKVVAVAGQPVRFCAPVAEALGGGQEEQAARYCRYGIDVTGVDLDALSFRVTFPGLVSGRAHLTGALHGGALTVTAQAPQSSPQMDVTVPCAAPASGWMQGATDANLDVGPISDYQAAHPGSIQTIALLRPSPTQVVAYVLSVGDPDAVEHELRAVFQGPLCVARSAYSQRDLDAAGAVFGLDTPLGRDSHAYGSTPSALEPDGQLAFELDVPKVTPALWSAAQQFAPGLVQFEPWLSPVA